MNSDPDELARVLALLVTLQLPSADHPDAPALFAKIEAYAGAPVPPSVRALLATMLHPTELVAEDADDRWRYLVSWDLSLIAEWAWDRPRRLRDRLARLVLFADDAGSGSFAIDPSNSLGHGHTAIYGVARGALSDDSTCLVARSVGDFLAIYTGEADAVGENILALRDAALAGVRLPPRVGDGTLLPDDGVSDVRFHPGVDAVRSAVLTRAIELGGVAYAAGPARFFRNGRVHVAVAGGEHAAGMRVTPGTAIGFDEDGVLVSFQPPVSVEVRGVLARAGERVSLGPLFHVVLDVDGEYRGFPCAAGTVIDDYGEGLGFHVTTARACTFAGRTIPERVRVTITFEGDARFDLVAPTEIDGRSVPAGAHVWLGADGSIREIHVRAAR